MKNNKLISMVEFIDQVEKEAKKRGFVVSSDLPMIYDYCAFLQKPLTLGMFVPTDLDGNVLQEPKEERKKVSLAFYQQEFNQYQQAKERVLFEGFEVKYVNEFSYVPRFDVIYNKKTVLNIPIECKEYPHTIEVLTKHKPTLTQTALKMIGR